MKLKPSNSEKRNWRDDCKKEAIRSSIVVDNVQEVLTRSKRRESSVERSAVCRCVSAVQKIGWTNQELGHEISCSVGTLQRGHLFHDNTSIAILLITTIRRLLH